MVTKKRIKPNQASKPNASTKNERPAITKLPEKTIQ